jgi:predicted dehydrogenase
MHRNIKMGLLGCGVISQYAHLAALKKADGVELVAVCDVAEALARQLAARYEVPRCYGSIQALLDDDDIEAVLIATADQHHVPNAQECLRRGRHVLVEKPLGASVEDCLPLPGALARSGKKLQVGNMKRFDPGIEFAARFIRERMGRCVSISGWYCDSSSRPAMQAALRLAPLRSPEQQSFDPAFKNDKRAYKLVTHGCHLVDTLRLFGGEIAAVDVRFADRCDCLCWHGLLEFADGAVGHFELTAAAQADWREGFWVHGEKGSVEIQSFHPFFNRASEVRAYDAETGEYRAPLAPDSDPYERQLEAFARAIVEDLPPSPDVHDGIADLRVLRAIAESVATGKRVEVERAR